MSGFVLTDENYYSPEANRHYMSCSQLQDFGECEAKAVAKLAGRWVEQPKEAFLVGNFFHSYFEGENAHKRFCEDNFDDIYKTKTTKDKATGLPVKTVTGMYAAFETAKRMIATVESDELMTQFIAMPGNNEQFMTGDIFGIPWRMKMDKYIPDTRYIIDYKTTANIWETSYNPFKGVRESFVESYGYLFRAAVYSMIEMQNAFDIPFEETYENLAEASDLPLPNFFLLCVSKQDYPDKAIIRLNNKQAYKYELEALKQRLGRVMALKEGRVLPKRCDTCDYCRATKKLQRVMSYYELSPEFRATKPEREEDYNATFGDLC